MSYTKHTLISAAPAKLLHHIHSELKSLAAEQSEALSLPINTNQYNPTERMDNKSSRSTKISISCLCIVRNPQVDPNSKILQKTRNLKGKAKAENHHIFLFFPTKGGLKRQQIDRRVYKYRPLLLE